ncbi:hypothetical protein D1872_330110 [compost metagenome]
MRRVPHGHIGGPIELDKRDLLKRVDQPSFKPFRRRHQLTKLLHPMFYLILVDRVLPGRRRPGRKIVDPAALDPQTFLQIGKTHGRNFIMKR